MNEQEARTILVTGATGAQGGSVARHLLERGGWRVRGFTRDPTSSKALALEDAGAQMVKGDLGDPETLAAALEGCGACFGVTNFWEHFQKEWELGRKLVDAVAASNVRHFVFSTLPNIEEITEGQLRSPHFDIKGRLGAYAREREIPSTFVQLAFYFENFLAFFPPTRREDGSVAFGFPQGDTRLAGVSVADLGGVVAEILARRDEFLGQTLYIVGDDLPPQEYAAIMTRVSGREIGYDYIPMETFASFDFPGAEDLANMFEFYRTRVPSRRMDLERSRSLYPGIRSFETWLEQEKEAFLGSLPA